MDLVRAFLGGGILPFGEAEAVETSRLFNAAGRPRRLRVDAMIAATAIAAGAELATGNREDFRPFEGHGLILAG
jgi:predicted nucleic acid-binding protein